MMREFHVQANVGRPRVAYRESITRPVSEVNYKYVKQTGGHGQPDPGDAGLGNWQHPATVPKDESGEEKHLPGDRNNRSMASKPISRQ